MSLGVVQAHLHVDAAGGVGALEVEAVDGQRRRGEVADVDAGGVEAADDGALEHAAGVVRVPAGGDVGALGDERAVGHGEAHGHLGGDVHVGQPAHAVASEERAGAAGLPDDGGADRRPRLDVLERVDLHVVGHHRIAADDRTGRRPPRPAAMCAFSWTSTASMSTAPVTTAPDAT